MMEKRTAIQATRLSKVLGGRAVLDRIELEVAEGESVAITGANGAGKTTLLRLLAAAIRPTAGEVRWFGRQAAAGAAARRLIGVVAHENRLYPHLTLRENLVFAARMCGLGRPARLADRWLRDVGLHAQADRLPARVSRGNCRRAAVARALVHDPPILLLDEPFCGLDAEARDWLSRLLLELRGRKRTLCLALHDEQLVERLADRALRLRSGRLNELAPAEIAGSRNPLTPARAA